ncbi:hypothetical protein [Streptomyces sp. SAJ15]|uniref:hypothetical protein n=1 Tax=Streptomyces sp. SAJ15 TaxID=2011095 RepID=UPI001184F5DB|nr:hypothetical protein [Streptomyces sp. SAJ15]TVL87902.1 hypothetical protein CD790_32355 [Streptomyces sp. SAJ15]
MNTPTALRPSGPEDRLSTALAGETPAADGCSSADGFLIENLTEDPWPVPPPGICICTFSTT